jgi:hypothetical protein
LALVLLLIAVNIGAQNGTSIPVYQVPSGPDEQPGDNEYITAEHEITIGMLRRALWSNELTLLQADYINDLIVIINESVDELKAKEDQIATLQGRLNFMGVVAIVCGSGLVITTVILILR